jgi:hypothetical protein
MPVSTFYKFTKGTRSNYGYLTYQEGLNRDTEEWNPADCVAGGLHATTLPSVPHWAQNAAYTHVWDVEIPAGETNVVLGEGKLKAHSLIMRNMRPIAEIFRDLNMEELVHTLSKHRALAAIVPTTRAQRLAINRATPVDTKVTEEGTVTEWSNGMHSMPLGDHSYRCTFTRDRRLFGSMGLTGKGSVIVCDAVRDGLPEGRFTYSNVDGYACGVMRDGYSHGKLQSRAWGREAVDVWMLNGRVVTHAEFEAGKDKE